MVKTCSACNAEKPISEFWAIFRYAKRATKQCSKCRQYRRNAVLQWYHKNREHAKANILKARSALHQDPVNRAKYLQTLKISTHRYALDVRTKAIEHYSNGTNRCACCGESHFEFLCIDHIDGGGEKHRKTVKGPIQRWLKKKGYPAGFRVLCHNCNASIGYYGYCPHAAKSESLTP